MPYIVTSRVGAAPTTVYLPWPQVLDTGIRELAAEALTEPGVSSVELTDDCRSRVLLVERERAGLAVQRPAGQPRRIFTRCT